MPNKILDGYAGRLGTTTFIGMNITKVVEWERYIYGLYYVIFVGEEDITISLTNIWDWSRHAELEIGYFISVVCLGVVGGTIRIFHNKYIQNLKQMNTQPPEPLNNVLIPSLIALTSMLLINAIDYKYAFGWYNGFSVGAYVAMASYSGFPA